MSFHHAAVAEMQPDSFCFRDQIADRQYQPVVDQDAVAGAFGAERLRAEGVRRNDRMQPDHRRQRPIEVEAVIGLARLECRRHFPLSQRGHAVSPMRLRVHRRRRATRIDYGPVSGPCGGIITAKWSWIEIAVLQRHR